VIHVLQSTRPSRETPTTGPEVTGRARRPISTEAVRRLAARALVSHHVQHSPVLASHRSTRGHPATTPVLNQTPRRLSALPWRLAFGSEIPTSTGTSSSFDGW